MNRTLRALSIPLATLALAACGGTGAEGGTEDAAGAVATTTPTVPPLQAVAEQCELPESSIGDDGATLILDGAGDDDRSRVGSKGTVVTAKGKLEIEEIGCALGGVDAPDSVVSMMEGTRAMDGRQTQDAGGYSYTWTYHPDNGLDIIITDQA